ncbi:MAG TPA: hypothetical protein VG387_00545 [Rhizomicrobium sp.]|jgi:hypothetical protein|nr:hypothetical protein [Rhizomicrobium sp.]
MRMLAALIASALLWTASTAAAPIAVNPNWGVLFPAEQAAALTRQCSRPAPRPQGAWQPLPSDIARLDQALTALLAGKSLQPAAYYRQYGGLVVNGRHLIYVNGARNAVVKNDWHSRAISICDGGQLAFGVEWDPASGAFSNFAFNGAL